MDFSIFSQFDTWIALLTLTFLEIVLGMDNIIFISIVSNKLPEDQQKKARTVGLLLALVFRIGLLLSIKWIIGLTEPILHLWKIHLSGRDLILLAGGLFLIYKSTTEIHHKIVALEEGHEESEKKPSTLSKVILQIVMLDIVFSFDSILTAVGLTKHVIIMIIAVILSMIIMISFSGPISKFINEHPTLQVLALSFLILIGFTLILEVHMFEELDIHVPKGYIYFAVCFSFIIELLNMRMRKNRKKRKKKKI